MPPSPDGSAIRVMSFNIRFGTAEDGENRWELRREAVFRTIARWNPDVLGMQEVLDFQLGELRARFPDFQAVAAGRDDGRTKGEMTAVMVRRHRFDVVESGHWWLSETPEVAGSKGWDAALPRMATWVKLRERNQNPRPQFALINTHFDHVGERSRVESARLLATKAEQMRSAEPVVLMGDFNAGEGSPPYRTLFSLETPSPGLVWQDTYRVHHPERSEMEATFHGFDVTRTCGPRIDWIACSKPFRVKFATIDRGLVEGRPPSDHFPILADLEWSRSPSGR